MLWLTMEIARTLVPHWRRQKHFRDHNQTNPNKIMAKTQNSQKQTKKQPLKTQAEKKADKRAKKNAR